MCCVGIVAVGADTNTRKYLVEYIVDPLFCITLCEISPRHSQEILIIRCTISTVLALSLMHFSSHAHQFYESLACFPIIHFHASSLFRNNFFSNDFWCFCLLCVKRTICTVQINWSPKDPLCVERFIKHFFTCSFPVNSGEIWPISTSRTATNTLELSSFRYAFCLKKEHLCINNFQLSIFGLLSNLTVVVFLRLIPSLNNPFGSLTISQVWNVFIMLSERATERPTLFSHSRFLANETPLF